MLRGFFVTPFRERRSLGSPPVVAAVVLLALFACDKKPQTPPQSKSEIPKPAWEAKPVLPDSSVFEEDSSEVAPAVAETLVTEPKLKRVVRRLRVDTLAWVGHAWNAPIKVKGWKSVVGRQLSGPEGMTWVGGALRYTPTQEGIEEFRWEFFEGNGKGVNLEASSGRGDVATGKKGEPNSRGLPLRFRLHALKPVTLEWSAVPGTVWVDKPVTVELRVHPARGMSMPVLVGLHAPGSDLPDTTLAWDGKPLQVTRRFLQAGSPSLHAIAWVDSIPADTTSLSLNCLAPIQVSLVAPGDTVEPGTEVLFKVGQPQGNGPFEMSLDVNDDGKPEWSGKKAAQFAWRADASGTFTARLKVTDSKGLTGGAQATWIVNRKQKVKAASKSTQCNLVTPFQVKLEYEDKDDTLAAWYVVWPDTLGKGLLDTVPLRSSNEIGVKHSGTGYAQRQWNKTGVYPARLCARSGDGRTLCDELKLTVFNANPTCKINTGLKPVPGAPIQLRGDAKDPDGKLIRFEWDLDGDGKYEWRRDANDPVPFTFARKGKFPVAFRVTSADGAMARDSVRLEVKKSW